MDKQLAPQTAPSETALAEVRRQLAIALVPLVGDELRRHRPTVERRLLSLKEATEYLGRSCAPFSPLRTCQQFSCACL